MREIKFRVWDKELMLMVDSSKYVLGMDDGVMFNNDLEFYKESNKIEIMQYTGLRDKDGRSIYESDIIIDHVGIGDVEYVERHAAFRVNYRNGRAKWFMDYLLNGEKDSIEVIGNIYENPELMEDVK